jgi:low affinity Fe/Cu permease
MTMMLLAIFVAAGTGMMIKEFNGRQMLYCVAIAASLTLIYFLRPWYMT